MRKYWRDGWNVSEGSNGVDVTRRKRKVVKRDMIQRHYSGHLLLRVLRAFKVVVERGYEADVYYEGVITRSHFLGMLNEFRGRVKLRQDAEMLPGIKHWDRTVYKQVISGWRISALVARRDSQGLRLAIRFRQSQLIKKVFAWLLDYRQLLAARRSSMENAVEFHSKGLFVEAFLRWVSAIERSSEMRLVTSQVCETLINVLDS
jgi:hypothetical protein